MDTRHPHIYTLSTHYLHTIYRISTEEQQSVFRISTPQSLQNIYIVFTEYLSIHYLYTIYILSTQYLQNIYTLADLELVQLGQAGEDLLGDEVHAAVLRPQVQLPLQPRVRADRESGARAVTCREYTR